MRNKLSPSEAASLRGKLGFAQTLMFGRLGRSRNVELIKRQYSQKRISEIRNSLRKEMKWWFKNIESLPHRIIKMTHEENNIIYSDAAGEGETNIGTILIPLSSTPPFKHLSERHPNG